MPTGQPTNGIAANFEDDTVSLGMLDNTYSPTVVEFVGELGLDFVWLDFEHGGPDPWDGPTVENLLRAAERTGIEPLVRLPATEPALVRKAMDLGVKTVLLPRVDTAEEVRAAVKSGHFAYDGANGDRGLAGPRARRWGLAEAYVERADAESLVAVTIETAEAVENIDAILDVPELGFVFIGPFDLSVSLGHPGDIDHPEVLAAVETVRSSAVTAGVPVGGIGYDIEDAMEKAQNGYDLLHLGSTTGAVKTAVDGWLDAFDVDRAISDPASQEERF